MDKQITDQIKYSNLLDYLTKVEGFVSFVLMFLL